MSIFSRACVTIPGGEFIGRGVAHRPLVGTLLAMALAVVISSPAMALDKTPRNMNRIPLVELEDIQNRPQAFMETTVRFRCTFAENTDAFDVTRTKFRPETYYAVAVWDDRARLYDPEVRANVLLSLYLHKDRFTPSRVAEFNRKYALLEMAGQVTAVIDGLPQIEVVEVRNIEDAGAWTDQAIYHVEQARLLGDDARDLAETHFVAALVDKLPLAARTDIALLRGRLLISGGAYAEAAKVLSVAIEESQFDDTLSAVNRAELYSLLARGRAELAERGSGTYQEAVESAQKALVLDPSNGGASAVLGISLAGLGQYDEARKACDSAVRLRPADAEVRWYLGRILDLQGRYDDSIEALKKAIDLTPKDHRIHHAIAQAFHHRGMRMNAPADLSTAVQEYDIALRLNPGNVALLIGSGQVLEDAAAVGVEVRSGSGRLPATLGMANTRYQQVLAIDPKNIAALVAAGSVQARLGLADEAAATIGKIEALGGDASTVKQALEKDPAKNPPKAPGTP